eukprot:Gb_34127 [translate_table: standard]
MPALLPWKAWTWPWAVGIFTALVFCIPWLGRRRRNKIKPGPKSWPLLGSTFELRTNFNRLYDWLTDYARDLPTFEAKYMGFRLLFTVDPANVEHILKCNFYNYVKGPAAHAVQYDLLGDGIFNSDGELWRLQRKSASLEFSSKMLRDYSTDAFRKYALRLAVILRQMVQKDQAVNMQDMFMRMTFDSICELGFGVEIGSLELSLPDVPFASSFDRSNALCASRYFDPLWKFKKRFNIGSEAKLKEDVKVLDGFTYDLIQKRRKFMKANADKEVRPDLLSRFLSMATENPETYTDKKLRDAILNFVIAGRDTTAVTLSWFFWLLSENPKAEDKIVQELEEVKRSQFSIDINHSDESCFEKYSELLTYDSLSKMHYLHAAITESLRLYPAVPLDGKTAVAEDTLPDGTKITKGNVINYVPFAMGRMERLWGRDSLEFKPERWLKDGRFQHESPFKYTAFQAGPRICLGKDSAYLQMKMAAAMLIRFFRFELEAGHQVQYMVALTLLMSPEGEKLEPQNLAVLCIMLALMCKTIFGEATEGMGEIYMAGMESGVFRGPRLSHIIIINIGRR